MELISIILIILIVLFSVFIGYGIASLKRLTIARKLLKELDASSSDCYVEGRLEIIKKFITFW